LQYTPAKHLQVYGVARFDNGLEIWAAHLRNKQVKNKVFACTNIPLVMEAVESCLVPPCNFSGIAPFAVENRQANTSKPSQQAVNKFDAFIANKYTEFREEKGSLAKELQALGFQNKLYTIPRWHLGKHDDTPTTQQIVKKKPTTLTGKADPKCKTGLIVDYHNRGTVVCCPEECGVCGASDECQLPIKDGKACPCANREGGADACCASKIQGSHAMCAETGPPCVVSYNHTKPTHQIINLYNLVEDPTERNNLANDPAQQERVKSLLARLLAIGATGPPLASAFPADVGMKNSTATAEGCAIEGASGYLLPLDWKKVV